MRSAIMAKKLFEISPDIDRAAAAERFARNTRVQIRNVLTDETAREMRMILSKATPWGLAMQGKESGPDAGQQVLAREMQTPSGQQRAQQLAQSSHDAAAAGDYAFRYAQYSLVQDVQEGWNPGGPHQLILEHLNSEPFLQLARDATGITELVKADGQATLFAAQHFLGYHIDSHVAEGWRVAYVLNLTVDDWKPDWGGYLQFFDDDGDVIEAFKPRFNSLNLLAVPQPHSVSYVPPFAPMGRFAVTGWLRDR